MHSLAGMKHTLFVLVLLFGVLNLGSCQDEPDTGVVKILFVGNSLTYTNNLPGLVTAKAKQQGVGVETEQLAYPNYALEDHWNDGKLQRLIKNGNYDYVIVQQGPSSQADGRSMLLTYGPKIEALCKKADSKLAFYMVWPAKANLHTFDGVITNYRDAAEATHSLLCPVGERWKEYFETTGDYSYYGPDGFHPSLKGSEVAATIIVNTLFPEP